MQQSWHSEELGHPCCGDELVASNNRELVPTPAQAAQQARAPGQTVFIAQLQPGQASKLNILYLSYQSRSATEVLKVALFLSGWFRFLTTNALVCPHGSSRINLDISNFSFNARDGFVSRTPRQENKTGTGACKNKISIPGCVCLWGTKQRKPKMTIIIQSGQRSCNSTCSSRSPHYSNMTGPALGLPYLQEI